MGNPAKVAYFPQFRARQGAYPRPPYPPWHACPRLEKLSRIRVSHYLPILHLALRALPEDGHRKSGIPRKKWHHDRARRETLAPYLRPPRVRARAARVSYDPAPACTIPSRFATPVTLRLAREDAGWGPGQLRVTEPSPIREIQRR